MDKILSPIEAEIEKVKSELSRLNGLFDKCSEHIKVTSDGINKAENLMYEIDKTIKYLKKEAVVVSLPQYKGFHQELRTANSTKQRLKSSLADSILHRNGLLKQIDDLVQQLTILEKENSKTAQIIQFRGVNNGHNGDSQEDTI